MSAAGAQSGHRAFVVANSQPERIALQAGVPLAVGTGSGSEMRRPLGIAIIGGLIFSQALTLYTTPVIYLYLDRLAIRFRRQQYPAPARGEV